jgi:hypothetical protein
MRISLPRQTEIIDKHCHFGGVFVWGCPPGEVLCEDTLRLALTGVLAVTGVLLARSGFRGFGRASHAPASN